MARFAPWIAPLAALAMLALASLACALQRATVTVENHASAAICYFDIRRADAEDWGDNLLGAPLQPGEQFALAAVEPGYYDFRAEPCDASLEPLEQSDIHIEGPFIWRLVDWE